MEYIGFQRCMAFLASCGLVISTLISDRHVSIAKHMWEKVQHIVHYFDLWHLNKSKFFYKYFINYKLFSQTKSSGHVTICGSGNKISGHNYSNELSIYFYRDRQSSIQNFQRKWM